ncbi:MAG TPA: alpha-L-rhamnosidase C-terminal domain-containing protein [Opitutaceae bacterium]|nr:alpha-L-rhamnosidase C-terminal domain-containing protein [Opitutaceae bacterium]HRJ47481.1 alpha-L-rhamnosidase C-terminal domain-containing protein [Opitutaceae bacterium]
MPTQPFVNSASWIWSAEGSHSAPAPKDATPSHYQVRYFRRNFTVANPAAAKLTVHLSADSRYLFWCNGVFIGRGPAKGDVNHHFYDTFNLTPHLRKGRNVLAALVLDMSRVAHRPALLGPPCSVMTYTGGWVLEGALTVRGKTIEDLRTDTAWRVAVDKAHRFQNESTTFEGYLGYFEHRLSALIPAGWNTVKFDDSAWSPAHVLFKAELLENRRDPASPYGLIPRMIPMLEEGEPARFPDAYVNGGGDISPAWKRLLAEDAPLTLKPGEKINLVLDMGALTTAFPQLAVKGGAGSVIRLTYAEALRLPWETPGAQLLGKKQSLANLASHFADESTGWTFDRRGKVTGWCDVWEPSGGAEVFEPLHWRAFRYVGLQIKVGRKPLTLRAVRQRFTAYPYKVKAKFKSSDAALNKIWTVGLHTMRMCSHETFEDCPHYEQMQYAGDTMITSKLAMFTTGDYRLSRQALYHFDWSRLSDGLTQARFPSRLVQIIPAWSIHWITNIKDYFYCTGDRATVADLLPGVRAVLAWYRRHTDETGLPAKMPYWNITDWCPWWPRGVVPGADTGPTCIHAAQYINALDEAAWMLGHCGHADEAAALTGEAAKLRKKAHELFWSESEGLYFDRPGGPEISQYGNAWAIVAGLAGERERAIIMKRFPHDPKLAPGSYFWMHTGFTALKRAGRYDEMRACLGPWHDSVNYGLSTFVEENSYWRSLCHAWSAHPVLEFQQRILGVTPTEPGFARIRIEPHLCGLTHAAGSVCTPHGMVEVAWRVAEGKLHLTASKPAAIAATINPPGGAPREFAGTRFEASFDLT